MNLKELTQGELLQASRGYKLWLRMREIGPDEFDGYFWRLVEDRDDEIRSMSFASAAFALLQEIASRWGRCRTGGNVALLKERTMTIME